MKFLRAGQSGPLSTKQAHALMAALGKPAAGKEAGASQAATAPPLPRITLAGAPDRTAKLLSQLEQRLGGAIRRADEAIARRSRGLDLARQAADPVLSDLRNARTFLPLAAKAFITARAALAGPEPDYRSARQALLSVGAHLNRASYLFREGSRLTSGQDPLRPLLHSLSQGNVSILEELEAVDHVLRKAEAKAS